MGTIGSMQVNPYICATKCDLFEIAALYVVEKELF